MEMLGFEETLWFRSEWSEMVRACVKEGWAYFEKSIGV